MENKETRDGVHALGVEWRGEETGPREKRQHGRQPRCSGLRSRQTEAKRAFVWTDGSSGTTSLSSSVAEAETILAELNKARKNIDGLPSSQVYVGCHQYGQRHEGRLVRRQKAAWAASVPPEEVINHLAGPDLRANLLDFTVLPALCYRFNRLTQLIAGLRSSDMRRMSRLRDPVVYMKNAKFRWAVIE
ncbi:unnamed protein product [Haemonchus placei]|uniref:Uncharacterized protein n=1 Tax=Haemonchus placei TaxID=6290 RepID=A0A0N4WKX0_HAEPC|nr:unnamed protein product [Haemonchus placei]